MAIIEANIRNHQVIRGCSLPMRVLPGLVENHRGRSRGKVTAAVAPAVGFGGGWL